MKTFEEVRQAYIKRYPNLANVKYGKNWKWHFSSNALRLEVPEGVTVQEVLELAKISNHEESNLK